MGWSAQYFTTIIIEGNTPQTGIFIYNGAPANGTLIGSWAAQAGTDQFGNTYPKGINVFQGQLTGVSITNPSVTGGTLMNSALLAASLINPVISGGIIQTSTFLMNSTGGIMLGYTTTASTITFNTAGGQLWTSTVTGPIQVELWGADAGAGGGNSSQGGEGGGGGEYGKITNYNVVAGQQYVVNVGQGGQGGLTGHAGTSGGDSSFDIDNGGPFVQGGQAGSNFIGGAGGAYNATPVSFPGGVGGGDGTQSTGGCGGGGWAGSTGPGGNGAKSVGAGGAAGGTAGTGTGGHAGGAGGGAGANGNAGGGGGGAGAAAGGGQVTFNYRLLSSATYYGSDGSNPNAQRSTGTMYQGGETAGGGGFNGTQKSLGIIAGNPVADLAGVTITDTKIRLNNLHSWYNSGIQVYLGYNGRTSLPSSWNGADIVAVKNWHQNENSVLTEDLFGSGFGTALKAGSAKAITLGPGSGSFNLSNYGYFYGAGGDNNLNPLITVTGTTGAGSVQAGNGADGMVVITTSGSNQLVLSASPISTVDGFSNFIPQGFAALNPDGQYVRIRGESTDNTGSNANTLAFIQVTKSWTIPANDARVGTGYRLRAWGTGTWPATAGSLNIRGNFTGAGGLGAIPVGSGEFTLGTAFKWFMETVIIIEGTLGATANYVSYTTLTLAAASGNQLTVSSSAQSAGQFASTGFGTGLINTTAAATMWIEAQWVTNAGSLVCSGSTLKPIGP
jgi:hypothetical protein